MAARNMTAVMEDLFEAEQVPEQNHLNAAPQLRALQVIENVLMSGKSLALAFSSGKDSSTCANLALCAAAAMVRRTGRCPRLHVLNADTGVESPVVRALATSELAKMKAFARLHGFDLQVHVSRPTLSSSYAVRVIAGRALPSFPAANADCAIELKVDPLTRLRKRIAKLEQGNVVTVIGTRSAESQHRSQSTRERGETAHVTWRGPEGDERLSPILDWDTDDVWTYLGECAAGVHPAYSDFADLMQFYGDAGGDSCVIVADMRSGANHKPCGARSGCWSCAKVKNDHSVEAMIAHEPARYPYLVPLLRLRNFIVDSQWDYSLRNFVGRTIDEEGFIHIRPDQYGPDMLQRLLRYTLHAQDEANALGAPAPVQPIGVRELIAIDWFWSLRAIAPPYTALRIYREHVNGNVQQAPKIEKPVAPSPCLPLGKLLVGTGWDDDGHPLRPTGLRHDVWESFSDSCGPSTRIGSQGQVFLDLPEEPEFDVDEEGASLFLEFEAERKLAQYENYTGDWTVGAMEYLAYGCVVLAKGQSSRVDNMMRRAQWLQRHGLHGQQDPEALRQRCQVLASQQHPLF